MPPLAASRPRLLEGVGLGQRVWRVGAAGFGVRICRCVGRAVS